MSHFAEPWEAEAFALAVQLQERGAFTPEEWSQALGAEIAKAPEQPYYRNWLAALETLVADKQLADAGTLRRYAEAWGHAAERTPHGTPIELRDEDFGDA
jgi:nitrile hydratase accessory protein